MAAETVGHGLSQLRLNGRPSEKSLHSNGSSFNVLRSSKYDLEVGNGDFPTELPDYEIKEVLGVGACGEVKRGVHKSSGRSVALKYLADENPNNSSKFTELIALRTIQHPHVVKLYDVVHLEGKKGSVLVLELLRGGELFDYLVSREKLTEREGQKFIRQVLSALEYCHRQGIAHRDLKLENMLLDSAGNIKITDFGFSNLFKADGLMSTFVGSPAYAAPEIVNNEKYEGPAADIWSLGVIIYTIIVGRQPFQDENAAASLVKISKAEFEIPDDISADAKDLIRKILIRRPDMRPKIAEIWKHPWIANGHKGPLRPTAEQPPDEVLAKLHANLKALKYDPAEIQQTILSSEVNGGTAAYHLLLERFLEEKAEEDKNAEIAAASARLLATMGGGGGGGRQRCVSLSTERRKDWGGFRRKSIDCKGPSDKEIRRSTISTSNKRKSWSNQGRLVPDFRKLESISDCDESETDTSIGDTSVASSNTSVMNNSVQSQPLTPVGQRTSSMPVRSSRDRNRASTWGQGGGQAAILKARKAALARRTKEGDSKQKSGTNIARLVSQNSLELNRPRMNRKFSNLSNASTSGSKTPSSPTGEQTFRCRVTTLGETTTSEVADVQPAIQRRMTLSNDGESKSAAWRAKKQKSLDRKNRMGSIRAGTRLDSSTPARAFGAATTSSLPVTKIVAEIQKALKKEGIKYMIPDQSSPKIVCTLRGDDAATKIVWHMEVCLLSQLGMHGIKLNRISGDIWEYKKVLADVMRWMKL